MLAGRDAVTKRPDVCCDAVTAHKLSSACVFHYTVCNATVTLPLSRDNDSKTDQAEHLGIKLQDFFTTLFQPD